MDNSAPPASEMAVETNLGGWRRGGPFLATAVGLWLWALASNLPYWRNEPNYSYGWAVPPLTLFFAWRRLSRFVPLPPAAGRKADRGVMWLAALAGLAMFPIEVYRVEYHQSGWVLWAVNLAAAAATLWGALRVGGESLMQRIRFPALFCLTSAPWPAVVAGRLQQWLMIGVANLVGEAMLWGGVPVRLDGAVLHLDKGSVGIVEACSGIRSLQSGFMVSLAVGELLGLTAWRRAALVGAAGFLALASNFGRTYVLCQLMESGGPESMHAWHDTVGNIAMYSLFFLTYGLGWLLESRPVAENAVLAPDRWRKLAWDRLPDARPLFCGAAAALSAVHIWYWRLEATTVPMPTPCFTMRTGPQSGNSLMEIAPEVRNRLGADSGEQVHRDTVDAPAGYVEAYHFFWRPSLMSRVALHHRPDACMPGSGWTRVGEVKVVELPVGEGRFKWYVFEFSRPGAKALQAWCAWRNGKPADMDFNRKLTALPERYGMWPSARHFMSVEVASLFVPYVGDKPPDEALLRSLLPKMFEWKAPQG
jgi:exosortase